MTERHGACARNDHQNMMYKNPGGGKEIFNGERCLERSLTSVDSCIIYKTWDCPPEGLAARKGIQRGNVLLSVAKSNPDLRICAYICHVRSDNVLHVRLKEPVFESQAWYLLKHIYLLFF
jgi:hypothetical protein